ncbi:MAG: hypothetical protein ACRD9S_21395 [Pyrinomonadaceae bacterium]
MIDHLDQQTQPLELEQPKRGRGRPKTGQAMTPAEKQRAYRQRLAEQRAEQVPSAWHKQDRAAQDERIEQLEQQLKTLDEVTTVRIKALENLLDAANKARAKAERELESRDGKSFWEVETCAPGKRTWKLIGDGTDPWETRDGAEKFAEERRKDTHMIKGWKYRIIQVKAPK